MWHNAIHNVWHERTSTRWHSYHFRDDSRLTSSQWETVLLCNNVSHWLDTNLEWALYLCALVPTWHQAITCLFAICHSWTITVVSWLFPSKRIAEADRSGFLLAYLRLEQTGWHSVDIFNSIFLRENFVFCFKFHSDLFLGVQFTICQHWLIHWGWVTHICVSKLGHHWIR